jgi:hypothetical protein
VACSLLQYYLYLLFELFVFHKKILSVFQCIESKKQGLTSNWKSYLKSNRLILIYRYWPSHKSCMNQPISSHKKNISIHMTLEGIIKLDKNEEKYWWTTSVTEYIWYWTVNRFLSSLFSLCWIFFSVGLFLSLDFQNKKIKKNDKIKIIIEKRRSRF